MFIKIETYIPFRSESEEMDSLAKELISLLLDVSDEIFLPLDDFGIASLNISKVDSNDIIKLKDIYPTHFTSEILELMHFKSEIDFELIYEFNHEALPDFVTNETMNSSYLTGIYRSRLVNFLIFSQLAIPGSLYTYKGFFLVDEKFHMDINPFSSSLIGGLAYEEKSNWPFIRKLPIIKVWDYIVNQTQILTTSSSNNIENGLNAFTYLYDEKDNSATNLFWAMSGIEALYAEGEIGIGYQIDKKSKVFLGEPKVNKKLLKELYNYRSKFLHGKMSIPINNGWLEGENDTNKHDEEISDMAFLSSKLLTVTLQEIIDRGLKEFKFEFIQK